MKKVENWTDLKTEKETNRCYLFKLTEHREVRGIFLREGPYCITVRLIPWGVEYQIKKIEIIEVYELEHYEV